MAKYFQRHKEEREWLTKLDMWQHLNGSSAPMHWTQAFPKKKIKGKFKLNTDDSSLISW